MSNSIADILDTNRFEEPPEVQIIKEFVNKKFGVTPGVAVQINQISISVPSAALAGALRMHLHELSEACQTKKRLVIRIQ
jgi:hypothetical protein